MNDTRFYALASIAVFTLAVAAPITMKRVGISDGQIASSVIMILGFAGLMIQQYRAAAEAAAKAEQVRVALVANATEMSRQTEAVRVAQAATETRAAKQAEVVKTTLAENQKEAAAQVAEVKETLANSATATDEKLESLRVASNLNQKTTEAVHTLVNSAFSKQLMIASVALHRVAELTGNGDDIEAAKLAADAFRDHEIKQKMVDKQDGPKP